MQLLVEIMDIIARMRDLRKQEQIDVIYFFIFIGNKYFRNLIHSGIELANAGACSSAGEE
jgi:hypothetical protein